MRRQGDGGVPLAIRRIFQTGADVLFRKIRKVLDDLFPTHSCRNPAEHIADSNAQSANARLSAPLTRLNCDDLAVIHTSTQDATV